MTRLNFTPEDREKAETERRQGLENLAQNALKGKENTNDLGKVRKRNNLTKWIISGIVVGSIIYTGGMYYTTKIIQNITSSKENKSQSSSLAETQKPADKLPPKIEKQFKDISSKLEKFEGNKLESEKILNENYLALNIPSGKTAYFEDKQTTGLSCYLIPFDGNLKQKDSNGKTEFSGSTYILTQIIKRDGKFLVSDRPTNETIEIPTNIKFKRNTDGTPTFESYTLTVDGEKYFILENDGAGVSVKGKERHYMPAWILIPENQEKTSRIYNEKCKNVSLEGRVIAPVPGKIAQIPTPTPTPVQPSVYIPEPPKYGKVILRQTIR